MGISQQRKVLPEGFNPQLERQAVKRVMKLPVSQSFAKSDLLSTWMRKYSITRTEANLLFHAIEKQISQ